MPKFKVKITSKNFSEFQLKVLNEAGAIVEECFNSEYFKQAVLNKTTEGKPFFHYTKDSREQVYDKVIAGAETLDPVADNEADIFIELDKGFSWKTIGYTYPNTKWQWVYNRFFKGASAASVAGNLAHEWMHKLGYEHEFNWTAFREHSVPYWVGYFVEAYANASKSKTYFDRFKAYFA